MEQFLIKSALTVSTPSVLLAFIPSKAGCSALMMWKVRSHVDLPLLAVRVTWQIGLIGGLAQGSITVFDREILALGMLVRWLDGKVLQEAAESIWKGICLLMRESRFLKSSMTKWPLSAIGG